MQLTNLSLKSKKMKKYLKISNIILISIFVFAFLLLIYSAKADTSTTDESVHLFAGYTYLTRGDFRLDPEHPPILKEISALPILAISNLKTPIDGLWDRAGNFYYDSWKETRTMSDSFLYTLENDASKLLFLGRLPFIFLTLVLGLAVYYWTNKLHGKKAGIFAAFLILFMPNILAHGRLINTDLGLTLFIFLSVYFWGEYLKKPLWKSLIFAGIFGGLAFASKYTSVLLIPIFLTLGLIKLFIDKNSKYWTKYLLGLLGIGIMAFIIIWFSYGFSISAPPPPIGTLSENIKMWANWNIPTIFDGIFDRIRPALFPADYYKGLILVIRHALGGHGSFLLGETSNTGWWYYFPVAIFVKTPIAFFIFLALSVIGYKKVRTKEWFDEALIIVPPLIYLLLSMNSKADLGVRHVLPIFPFLAICAAKSINLVKFSEIKIINYSSKKLISALVFSLLILWYLLSSVLSYPNYIAYFNESVGGSADGYKVLTDSNLDWGQDILRMKSFIDEHHLQNLYVVYPWDSEDGLRYYGINSKLLKPEDQGIKGDVIISATYLQSGAYDWLKKYSYQQITPGVFYFRID